MPPVIPKELIADWLSQFASEDRWVPERLLEFFRFYDVQAVTKLLSALHAQIHAQLGDVARSAVYVPCGDVASSASLVAYMYRQSNQLSRSSFVSLEALSAGLTETKVAIILDDFCGSGHSAARIWKDYIQPLHAKRPDCKFVFACMVAHQQAIEYLAHETNLHVVVAEVIPATHQPFSQDSEIFPTAGERERAATIVEKYSANIPKGGSLGYAATQSLVGFFFNTPDNTLPLFWAPSDAWHPLLLHGADLVTFSSELKSGRVPALATQTVSAKAVRELSSLEEIDIGAERSILVLQEFNSNAALKLLQPIIASLAIDAATLQRLLSLSRKLRYALHEQRSVCTALFVVSTKSRSQVIPRCFVVPNEPMFVGDEEKVCALAELADGIGGAVAITEKGEVLGCLNYSNQAQSELVPRRLSFASGECRSLEALAFVFVGNGRTTVLAEGVPLLTHRQSTWYPRDPQLATKLHDIAEDNEITAPLLLAAFQLATELSDAGEGAILVIGDEKRVAELCDPRTTKFHWNEIEFLESNWSAIRPLAKQDGAILVARNGKVVDGKRILRPPPTAKATIPAGSGARHSSAAKITAVTTAIAVVVSDDGPISIFAGGELALRVIT